MSFLSEKEIMYNWEDDISTFFMWIEEVCSLHRESEIYKSLKMSVRTNSDLKMFVEVFDGDFDRIDRTASKYLLKRVG
jgi:hypothetical protein